MYLPYKTCDLEPFVSGQTLCLLSDILVQYQNKLPNQTDLVDLLKTPSNNPQYRYAVEYYSSAFALSSLHSACQHQPSTISSELSVKIYQTFGSFEKFFCDILQFGNSDEHLDVRYLWLVSQKDSLRLMPTIFESPLTADCKPLFAINLTEKAYLLDYQTRKGDYLKNIVELLLNWQAIENRYFETDIWQP